PRSQPTLPLRPGINDFRGPSFHTYYWPHEGIDLKGKRVGIVGTGATAIQIIPVIAEEVETLHVFQRRPNWSAPLNNSPISEAEMADIQIGRASRRESEQLSMSCGSDPYKL